jgi:hypothetical protein
VSRRVDVEARSEDEPVEAPPLRPKVPLGEDPRFKLATGLIGVIGVFLAALYLFAPDWFPVKPPGPGGAGPTTAEADAGPVSSHVTGESSPAALAVGSCLTGDGAPVSCNAEHALQVVSPPGESCAQEDLVHFLRGVPGIDLLITSPEVLENATASSPCIVALPEGVSHAVSWKGRLPDDPMADSWRRCADRDSGDDRVPCSAPHSGEYIGLGPNESDCVSAFQRYAQIRFEDLAGQLSLSRVQLFGESSQSCLVSVLGANKLSKSIRNLRTGTLPLIPG